MRYYTVEEAARVLRLTPERVREMLEAGEIEGVPTRDPSGAGERWRIPIHGDVGPPPPPVTAIPTETPTGHSEARDVPEEPPEEPAEPPATVEDTRQPAEIPRGDAAEATPEIAPEPTSESGWVTTQQAARALGISARTVRWHIDRGNLEAKPEGEGVERAWRVSVDSLQAFRDSRQAAAPLPRGSRAPEIAADIAAESPGNAVRELADRLVEEARRAEAARVRLELSERAQSTLEAELSDERRRREEAERERDDLRRELHEWHRLEDTAETTAHDIHDRLAEEQTREDAPSEPAKRGAPESAGVESEEVSTAEAAAGALKPPESPQEAPEGSPGLAPEVGPPGVGPQRQISPRRGWWRRWRRS